MWQQHICSSASSRLHLCLCDVCSTYLRSLIPSPGTEGSRSRGWAGCGREPPPSAFKVEG
jgi:hypothetical protein